MVSTKAGKAMRLGVLEYSPQRNGPTIWQIGIPDRTAAKFYIPDPNPTLINQLYVKPNTKKNGLTVHADVV
ncbi:hypothetical protein RJ640_000677 [Escallonia rubra]|uniref:Rhamnogalacturonan lyase domain-containing protein n=1 Tax=Escallonia rubra TaxID=112253 RepID=A0AA88QT96_9ASTE|nr:hypothetical protein RJ640_000677 [Escallonia rubra]